MNKSELEKTWNEIDAKKGLSQDTSFQQMICIDLLYRVYIGVSGIPAKRFISLEIPKSSKEDVLNFEPVKGFEIEISEPTVKNDGFVSCTLQASSSDQNDVFTIISEDILVELYKHNKHEEYINALLKRINKWRDFFKSISNKKLSETQEIGLFGELSFINFALDAGVDFVSDMWNGPIRAAQDFQNDSFALEVKTVITNAIEYVKISSEEQLDISNRNNLFLLVYRIEHDEAKGQSLPDLIDCINSKITATQSNRFMACLLCLGYNQFDCDLYDKKYSVRENVVFEVKDDFPRLYSGNIPAGVKKIKYSLNIEMCKKFESDITRIIDILKE
ncbi:MAG: PD-(D/E)XK motif protein [Pseudobutyrivibrio sp.]|nr:PD-(D/E)XK motif protein [Pseudobutyrivibrio sp.]